MTSAGGRFALRDNGETPDTQDALFEYPGWSATWSERECCRGAPPANGLEFCGTRGSLLVSRRGFIVTPDSQIDPADAIPRFGSAHPAGGPIGTGQRESAVKRTEAIEDRSGNEFDQFRRHAGNFLDCVRSRQDPISDLEGAHRVVTACHLANPSLRLGRKLRWDAENETILDDAEAAKMLERPYRAPWDSVLKSLGVG